ncbi:hypothetical protein PLEOSDRAFT_1111261 [Pleurotus ostreatus PC15]|uniref:Uncharacterized protein n=2 Tax=Pleurotus TaxID=5320 RepID=A0A067NR23_PLEO1|nr:hypothetical protein CCMSSC00406_0000081 [Pleurotus cornucopiae]KDQ30344.1 hypothetical protein PLEOSDRAFT_1111261 [Pleurotus ostreatus PC15]
MPPKPRPILKQNSATIPSSRLKEEEAAKAMPPPPDPPKPARILEPEMKALSSCLQNAAVKTAQIYKFYADTHKLGVQQYTPGPPSSLTASLGREIEKYDQLCDAIETQLLRAVSVLQRDLAREERRVEEEEAAAAAIKAANDKPLLTSITTADSADVGESSQPKTPTRPSPGSNAANPLNRRPSSISISSLHRAPFPLKLDLSSPSLRTSPEDVALFSGGLASPIVLGQRPLMSTGPPPEFNPELLSAFASSAPDGRVDIDLTLADSDNMVVGGQELANIGNSADKPIELDLESMDIDMENMLFGQGRDATVSDNPFSSADGMQVEDDPSKGVKAEENIDADILDALTATAPHDHDNIFGDLSQENTNTVMGDGSNAPTNLDNQAGESPGSMLRSFEAAAANLDGLDQPTLPGAQNIPDGGFDFLNPEFFASTQDPDLDDLFSTMGEQDGGTHTQTDEEAKH